MIKKLKIIFALTIFVIFTVNCASKEKQFNYDTDKLYKLCKVWGFVKYHTPYSIDFDQELFDLLQYTRESVNNQVFDNKLSQWVHSINEYNKIAEVGKVEAIFDSCAFQVSFDWIEDSTFLSSKLIEELSVAKKSVFDTNQYVYFGKWVTPVFSGEKKYETDTLPNTELCLLTVFRYWNIVEYYFPYRYTVADWDKTLKDFIPKFLLIKNKLELVLTLKLLMVSIEDGHAMLYNLEDNVLWQKYFGDRLIPVVIERIHDKYVIVDYLDSLEDVNTKLRKGDIILKIHNTIVDSLIKLKLPYMPGSNRNDRINVSLFHILKTFNKETDITFCRGKDTITTTVKTSLYDSINYTVYNEKKYSSLSSHYFLQNDIGYVCLGNIVDSELADIMKKFQDTKAIIIDLRYYPKKTRLILYSQYLIDDSKPFFIHTGPHRSRPGCFLFLDSRIKAMKTPVYKGKIYVLVNYETMSAGELTVMALQSNPNTKVIGNQTVGANGSVSYIPLPFNIKVVISGSGVYYPDGTKVHNKGVKIDYEVYPEIKDLQEGRDTYIEKALELINNK